MSTTGKHAWAEYLRERVDIVGYIQRSEPLRQRGTGVWEGAHAAAKHGSKSGTCLSVFPNEGTFVCNNCKAKGDVINFVMDRDSCDFVQACETLANEMGLSLPERGELTEAEQAAVVRVRDRKRLSVKLLQETAVFYHRQLTPAARAYFHGRGISDASIDELRLGYAPETSQPDPLQSTKSVPARRVLVEHLYRYVKQLAPDMPAADIKQLLLSTGLFVEDGESLLALFKAQYIFPYYLDAKQTRACYFIGRDATGRSDKKYQKQYYAQDFVCSHAVQHILWNKASVSGKQPVLVVEGIIDAILARQTLGDTYDVISPVTTSINKTSLADLVTLVKTAKPPRVIFCNDSEVNAAGMKGALTSAQSLQAALLSFYEKAQRENGATDAEAEKQAQLACPDIRIATLPRPPELDKIDVADYLQQGKVEAVKYWLRASRSLEQVQQWLEDNPRRFFTGKTFRPKRLSDELRTEGYYAFVSQQLHYYEGGCYRAIDERISSQIEAKLGDEWKLEREHETLAHLKIGARWHHEDVNTHAGVNLQNGILSLNADNTVSLLPHSPEHQITLQFPAKWVSHPNPEKFLQFLSELVSEADISVLVEMIGYCMLNTVRLHKAFVLKGDGANGKSTLIRVIKELLGPENICTLSIQRLQENRFASSELFGKAANLCPDMSISDIRNADIFKSVVSGDRILAERKHTRSFEFDVRTKQVVSVNALPRTYDSTQGFFRRLIIIDFPHDFDTSGRARDQDAIVREVLAERDDIVSFCLLAAVSAVAQGKFSVSQHSLELLGEYQLESRPELLFIQECLGTADEAAPVAKSYVYKVYQAWLKENDARRGPLSQAKLTRAIKQHFGDAVAETQERIDGRSQRGWRGLTVLVDIDSVDMS